MEEGCSAIISDMFADTVPLSDTMYARLYSEARSDMHAGFIYSDMRVCKACAIRYGIWSVTNSSQG